MLYGYFPPAPRNSPIYLEQDDASDLLQLEWVKNNELVDAIDELGTEV